MAWYDEIFDNKYDLFTFHLFSEATDAEEAEFIRSALQLQRGEEVLDLACGHGRHAIPLARAGIRITGLDASERYLDMARSRSQGSDATFVSGDMRTLDIEARFDAAYCFFNSFGFFDEDTNFDILKRVARSLRPGGRFLLDMQNRELYSPTGPLNEEVYEFEHEGSKCVLISRSRFVFETGFVNISMRLFGAGGGPRDMSYSVRLYAMPELTWLFQQAGLSITSCLGDYDGSLYTSVSERLIAIAKKQD